MPTSLFANNLKFLRKMRGLSQQKLAEHLGLKRNNIASYEAGIVEPRAINFLKLALFFEISPSEMLEQDVSAGFMDMAPHRGQRPAPAEEEILLQMSRFSSRTSDMQKVLEGFREFQKLGFPPGSSFVLPGQETEQGNNPAANGELDTLLDIMEQLLESNWKLIRAMTKEEFGE